MDGGSAPVAANDGGSRNDGGRATQLPTQILVDRVRTLWAHLLAEQEGEKQAVAKNKSRFKKNDVTKLLFATCDKLTQEKDRLEQRNYEEHSADLHLLCRLVGTDLEAGISDKACQEKLHEQCLSLQEEAQRPSRKQQARGLLAMCFTSEFPPSKDWWLSAKEFLAPKYEVWRDNQLVNVLPSTLVPGDIICLHRGFRAPCDVRILVTVEGTSMDAPCSGSAVSDIRICTTDCTSTDIKSSRNIVLKDSWIVSGSLVGLVVRAPMAPIIPEKLKASKDDFILDMNLPSGLSQSTCRNTFTNLCIRAGFTCKSFGAIPRLAQVQALVIVLDRELLSPDSSALSSLLASAKQLNKSVFLVGAQEQMVDEFQNSSNVGALKVLDLTPSPEAETASSELPPGSGSSGGSAIDANKDTEPGLEEQARLDPLIDECAQGDTCAVVLHGISEVALCYLCASLQERGLQLLYALGGHFRFPRCLRSLIVAMAGNSLRAAGDFGSERSEEALSSELLVAPRSTLQSVIGGEVQPDAESASVLSDSAAYGRSMVALGHPKRVLLVSVGLKGILAERADCVLLKPDLACLGQALDIATRAVPAAMLGGAPAGRLDDASRV